MDIARLTDERLKSALNGNQPSRERLCLGVLGLDRNYSNIQPRLPEGGPDNGRDIECIWNGQKCHGAVGFKNNANDSSQDKREIRDKFREDIKSSKKTNNQVRCFVFFCNVNLTPRDIENLKQDALNEGFTHVDIYWRERIRIALDSPEGLAYRFQYLDIELSKAEQGAFFARYGKELEEILRGRFDRIDTRLDSLEFSQWKTQYVRNLKLDVQFKKYFYANVKTKEHFRIALELQGLYYEKRGFILGIRDEFVPAQGDEFYFGTKKFFWDRRVGKISDSWIKSNTSVYGGVVSGVSCDLMWQPQSPYLATEFNGLHPHFHFTENLIDRIDRVTFKIDDYIFIDWPFNPNDQFVPSSPSLGWPDELTEDEGRVAWRLKMFWGIDFDTLSPKSHKEGTQVKVSPY